MTETIEVRECCYICKNGIATSATTVMCCRGKTGEPMDYLETCRHFELMNGMKPKEEE